MGKNNLALGIQKLTVAFILLIASPVDAGCPRDCFGCDTTSVSCYIRSPFRDMHLIPIAVQDVTINCLSGGKIETLLPLSKLNNLLDLKISGCFEGALTGDVLEGLSSLKMLNLSNNKINSVSKDLLQSLSKLDIFDLSNNSLASLPADFLTKTTKLEKLYLDGNQLSDLPSKEFSALPFLRYLSLSNNNFRSVKGLFLNSRAFTWINLNHNQLESIRYGDFDLPNLQYLDLSHNRLSVIDKRTFHDTALITLILADNLLTKVDQSSFPYLDNLDLSNNLFQTLPASFSQFLQNLRKVDLSGNPFHCNCDMDHLRIFYKSYQTKVGDIKCKTPLSVDFKDANTPFNCVPPTVSISQASNGIVCEVRGDPSPSIDWIDFKTGKILLTSPAPNDASITSHSLLIKQQLLHNYNELMCRTQNSHDSASEKCYVFDFTANVTAASAVSNKDEATVKMSVFIGSIVGVFFGTLCLMLYFIICVKYSKCGKRKENEKDLKHYAKHRPYYAQPTMARKRNHKMTPRPWEFPPHVPYELSIRAKEEDNIYATINEEPLNPRHHHNNTSSAMIEELAASDEEEDVKPPIHESPDSAPRSRAISASDDTPNTSSTTLPMSTPAQSADPLPLSNIDPDSSIDMSIKSATFNPTSSASASDLPYIFAANRRMSDRLGIRSMPGSKRPSVMIVGDVSGIPGFDSGFNGIQMERTASMDFGYELEV